MKRAVAAFIADWLAGAGAEVEIVDVEPGRRTSSPASGSGGGPTLCLNAHCDTVGYANWPEEALVPRLDGDRLYGLGAADDKGMCAAAMLTLESLARSGGPRATFSSPASRTRRGCRSARSTWRRWEASTPQSSSSRTVTDVVVEHQGFGWIDIVTHGVAAHGSAPDKGVDAIVHLAEVISRLHRHDVTTFVPKPDPMNGRTVFHTGTVKGGTDYATYPNSQASASRSGLSPGNT